MLYLISAQSTWETEHGHMSLGVPTFFLDGDVQGLTCVSDAACFAGKMLCDLAPEKTFHIGACDMDRNTYAALSYSKELGPHNVKPKRES